MSSDKKEYRAAIEVINGIHSPSQFHEKLNKLFVNTEDTQFRKLILPVLKAMKDAHSLLAAKKMSSQKTAINYRTEPYLGLVKYCQQQLAAEKPTWQILAERNGWRPPSEA